MAIPPVGKNPKTSAPLKINSVSKTVKVAKRLGSQQLFAERQIDFAAKEVSPKDSQKLSGEISKISRWIRGK